jgi:nitrous oxidase accessory protein NosD
VTIHDITLKDGVGDGISVGGHSGTPTDDLVIDNVRTDNNRRQGLSLVWATNVVITDSTFANTNGTSPECGIDIEPENGQEVSGVLIENCKFETNAKYGINLLKRGTITATVDDITIKGCTIGGSVSAGNLSNGIVTINASNVTVQDSTIAYNHVTGLVTQNTASLTVTNNVFKFNRTNGGIDSTDTAHLIASGLNSPGTDAHIQIKSAASGQSITNNTFYY